MLLNLNKSINQSEQSVQVVISTRLPTHIQSPCNLTCRYDVKRADNYFLLTMAVSGELIITCQRCLQDFNYAYSNELDLAICPSDEVAEKLMSSYECVVAQSNQVDLSELICDELYLYAPQFHPNRSECGII